MLSFFKKVDTVGESVIVVVGSIAKLGFREFRQHPIETPLAIFGGALVLSQVPSYIDDYNRYRQRVAEKAQSIAESNILAEQVTLTISETTE